MIRLVDFESSHRNRPPVEVASNLELFTKYGRKAFDFPDRPSFRLLMLVESGSGSHSIDFRELKLIPKRMLRVNPDQVQRWDTASRVTIDVVMSGSVRTRPTPWVPDDEPGRDLGADSAQIARSLVSGLRLEQARFDGGAASVRLMDSMFDALEAVFERAGSGHDVRDLPAPYVAFRAAIEENLSKTHQVNDYSKMLGYSERTLSRACLAVTGRTAKGVLTDRLVLEAKRLLAHTDLTTSAIGRQLGFREATNFSRFFNRTVGEAPADFRESTRSGGASK